MNRFKQTWHWAIQRPTVIVNVIGLSIMIGGGLLSLLYFSTTKIDVLDDWRVDLVSVNNYRVVDGKRYPVYNPGGSLIFTSEANKLSNANGTTNRSIVCKPTDKLPEREIMLDTLPANRPAGETPVRDNGIVVPEVSQFAELPRFCKLVITIGYKDVVFWRDHNEYAETDYFIVEERELSPASIRSMIDEANRRIKDLENRLSNGDASDAKAAPMIHTIQPSTAPKIANPPAQQPTARQPEQPEPEQGIIDSLLTPITNLLGGN